jgi:hypothetical protein
MFDDQINRCDQFDGCGEQITTRRSSANEHTPAAEQSELCIDNMVTGGGQNAAAGDHEIQMLSVK